MSAFVRQRVPFVVVLVLTVVVLAAVILRPCQVWYVVSTPAATPHDVRYTFLFSSYVTRQHEDLFYSEAEASSALERQSREGTCIYTALLRDPEEMQKARDRPFYAWISGEITPFPGLYKINKGEFDHLSPYSRLAEDQEMSEHEVRTVLLTYEDVAPYTNRMPPNLLVVKVPHSALVSAPSSPSSPSFPHKLNERVRASLDRILIFCLVYNGKIKEAAIGLFPEQLYSSVEELNECDQSALRSVVSEGRTWGLHLYVDRTGNYELSVVE